MNDIATTSEINSETALEPLAADDPRSLLARTVAIAASVIDEVRVDQMELPTPCDEYDVRQLLAHMCTALRRVAFVGRGEHAWSVPAPEGVADDGWLDVWRAAAHEVQGVWSDDSLLEATMVLPWVTASGGDLLHTYVNEITVHTWDLATATGQSPSWDAEVIAVAFDAVRRTLPVEGRKEAFEKIVAGLPAGSPVVKPPFGAAVDVADDAPAIERLVAWSGRRP